MYHARGVPHSKIPRYERFDILGICHVIFARSCWKWRIRHEKFGIPKALKEISDCYHFSFKRNIEKESQVIFYVNSMHFGSFLVASYWGQIIQLQRRCQLSNDSFRLVEARRLWRTWRGNWICIRDDYLKKSWDIGWMGFLSMTQNTRKVYMDLGMGCMVCIRLTLIPWTSVQEGSLKDLSAWADRKAGFGADSAWCSSPNRTQPWQFSTEGQRIQGLERELSNAEAWGRWGCCCCMLMVLGAEVPKGMILW